MKHKEDIIPEQARQMYTLKTDRAWSRIRKVIDTEKEVSKKPAYPLQQMMRVAAGIIVLASLSLAVWLFVKPDTHRVKTVWNQKKIVLADGSTIYLNGHSSLRYPVKFSAKERHVQLQGEAFFEITKDPTRPFIVETNDAKIQVYGTSFNVKSFTGDHRVEVWVNTGIVSLSSNKNKSSALILRKGEFGLLEGTLARRLKQTQPNYLSWHTKVFRFDKTPLSEAVAVLSHAYAKNIVLADSSLTKFKLTASFDGAHFTTVLKSICLTFHLHSEEINDQIILRSTK